MENKLNCCYNTENDINILKSLYFGNHLNDNDLERALKLIKLLEIGLKERLK